MTTLFDQAVKGIRSNPQPIQRHQKEPLMINQAPDTDPDSILNRIVINKKISKLPKEISLRKENDGSNSFDSSRIQKKTQTKGVYNIHKKVVPAEEEEEKGNNNDQFEDLQQEEGRFTVMVRNLAASATDVDIKKLLPSTASLIDINVENGRGEIIFSKKEVAKKATSTLNNTLFKGSKIKANFVPEIIRAAPRPQNIVQNTESQLPNYNIELKPEKQVEKKEKEDERPSIFSRIKKSGH